MKVHLVDGTYELFRAYFGPPPARNRRGREVGASRGLFATLVKLLSDPEVTHVACAFDHVVESFRNDLFAGYKTGEGMDPELFGQFELAEQVSRALGIVTCPMVEFEADDAIATLSAIASRDSRVDEVLLCSPDKDLAQCVRGDRVVMLDRMRGTRRNEDGVVEKFGVPPASIPDFLALVGDAADGIPGIPGFGAKTAAALLSICGTVEGIPDDPSIWTPRVRGAPRLAANLAARRPEARLYRLLATLRTDVPIGLTVDDLEWKGASEAHLDAVCEELGASDLAERARSLRHRAAVAATTASTPAVKSASGVSRLTTTTGPKGKS